MNTTTTGVKKLKQGLILFVSMSVLIVMGAVTLAGGPSSNAGSQPAPQQGGTELAITGEVVMIEGIVQLVEDPFSEKKDAYMVMEYLYVAQIAGDQAIELHVNDKTLVEDDLRIGDRVEVVAAPNGEALSVKKTE